MFGFRKILVAFLAINVTVVLSQEELDLPGENELSGTTLTSVDQKESSVMDTSPTITSNEPTHSTEGVINSKSSLENETVSPPSSSYTETVSELLTGETDEPNSTVTKVNETTTEPIDNFDACDSNPCQNEGTCTEVFDGEFICSCTSAYVGKYCEVLNKCKFDRNGTLCKNGACISSENMEYWYCQCFIGTYWDDQTMECRGATPPCFPNPCLNYATCKAINNKSYECKCAPGYTGTTCEIVNECYARDNQEPCKGGHCALDESGKRKYCQCSEGQYYDEESKSCQVSRSPCLPNPCGKYGSCDSTSEGSYNCTCNSGYIGSSCEILNECPSEGCLHGNCLLLESDKLQRCQCNEGYFLNANTKNCEEVQEPCLPNPCENKGTCTVTSENNFTCSCVDGYFGDKCSNRDLCKLKGGDIFCQEAHCVTHHEANLFYCQCKTGEYFDYAKRECKVLDMCPLMTCKEHEICEESMCKCKKGYDRNNTSMECRPNFCLTVGCPSTDMVCNESVDGKPENFQCFCPHGQAFDGTHCTDVSCVFPSLNECDQKCDIVDGRHMCSCYENFTLKSDNTSCEFLGQMSNCVDTACKYGTCVKVGDEEHCICPNGYVEDNGNCIDLCSAKQLPFGLCPDQRCESVADIGFRCQCMGNFQHATDVVTCTRRKMCTEGEIGWTQCLKQNAFCVEDESSIGYKCKCSAGFVGTTNGCLSLCNINEHEATCSNLGALCDVDYDANDFVCRCPVGFKNMPKGERCNKLALNSYLTNLPIDNGYYIRILDISKSNEDVSSEAVNYSALQGDLTKSMRNLFADFEAANIIKCKMQEDYVLCKAELQFKVSTKDDLKKIRFPSVCQHNESISLERCLLPPGLVLRRDKIQDEITIVNTNVCDDDIKDTLCGIETTCANIDNGNNFICSCKAGYRTRFRMYPLEDTRTFIEECKDIDECAEGNPCSQFTACANTQGGYDCPCLPGYKQKDNMTDHKDGGCTELCSPNPCIHGECSKTGAHSFQCSCDVGYKGALCDFEDRLYKDAKMNTVIVGAVLGGILLITCLLFVTSITRFRKRKYLEEPAQILYTAEMTERRMGTSNRGFDKDL